MMSAGAEGRFPGKTVVVTGAASGIGLATARRFAAEGATLILADIQAEKGAALAEELAARFVRTDVTDPAAVEALAAETEALDVWVNNAGAGIIGLTPDLPVEAWRAMIALNLDAVFFGCRAAIPAMRRNGGGAIVNVASISGLCGDYGFTVYNAAKGGVINYTRAAAIDHAREGIRINAVCPGLVDTPAVAPALAVPGAPAAWNELIPMGRPAQPAEIAAVIAFLASADASYMTGAAVVVDGGATAHTGQPNLLALAAKAQGAG